MTAPLTPDPSISPATAATLGDMHASLIALARSFAPSPPPPICAQIIERHTQALIELGYPRVADDLTPNGWTIHPDTQEWRRPTRPDEWPFPIEPLYDDPKDDYVYAENNHHARMLDGLIPVTWLSFSKEHYVV